MRKPIFLLFLIFFCAELSAQNYYLRSLDLDTGLNLIRNAHLNKISKEVAVASSTYLLDTSDAYNRYVLKTHFTKLDSSNQIVSDKSFILFNSSIRIRGTIKLLQEGYVSYGLYYDSKAVKNKTAGIPGCIIRYNDNGDTLFTMKFPFRKDESEISSFKQLPDSSFIFVAFLKDSNGAFSNLFGIRVVRLNPNFGITWDSVYYYSNGTDINSARPMGYVDALIQTNDKGFLIGTSINIDSEDPEYHATVFKIDSIGKFRWETKFYGNNFLSVINRILKLRDGNLLLVGDFEDYDQTPPYLDNYIIVIKMNEHGTVLWKKLVYKYEFQYILDVDEFPNGNILLAGQIDVGNINLGFDPKAALICLNENGEIIWDRQYDFPSNNTYDDITDLDFSDIEIADDNSIMAVGNLSASDQSFPYNNGHDLDLLFLHADSLGCIMPGTCPITNVEQLPLEPNYFYTYPNPTSNTIGFKSNLSNATGIHVKIVNTLGQLVLQKTILDFNEQIDVSEFAKGIYVVELSAEDYVGREKIIVE